MLDKILKTVQDKMPGDLPGEVKRNVEAVIRSSLEKMNLVSREELEIQQKILERTRSKVDELEQKILELEKQLQSQQHSQVQSGQ